MIFKVWYLAGYSDGDSDIETVYIVSDSEQKMREMIKDMSGVIAFIREGVGVSEGLERTPSPSPLSPSLCEVLL